MNLGYILRRIRSIKGFSLTELSIKTGISKSSLSNIENNKNNPTIDTLSKICDALEVETNKVLDVRKDMDSNEIREDFFDYSDYDLDEIINDYVIKNKNTYQCGLLFSPKHVINEITTAEDAVKFILSQPSVGDYGNFDIDKLSDEDKINFANDLLDMIKMISPKYNK